MRYSYFNSLVEYHGKFILYNSFSNKFLLLVEQLKDLLLLFKKDIEGLKDIHPAFYSALLEGDFLVKNELDEVDEVKKLSRMVDLDDTKYKLTINPTMNCNFKCWYCYETHVKKSRMDEEIVARTKAFISNIAGNKNLKHFNLSWFGGEPLLYFHDIVLPIMDHFVKICSQGNINYNIGFTTNGYLINQSMLPVFKEYNVRGIQITLDGHEEDHDKVRFVSNTRGSYKEIIANIKLLVGNEIPVTVRINYTLENIAKCGLIAYDLMTLSDSEKQYILIDFHRVWQDNADDREEIILEQVKTFRFFGLKVNSHYLPDNVVHSCYADKKNSATINYNGDVFKCTARDFTTYKREGYIEKSGEIVWENDSLIKRLNAKFNNKPCLRCRILPICNGGCSQHALERIGEDYCVHKFDEKEKDKVVISKFEAAM